MQSDLDPGCPWFDALPAYVDARLRGAGDAPPFAAVRAHLVNCKDCAAIVAMTVVGIEQREADARPFDDNRLPDPIWSIGKQLDQDLGGNEEIASGN